MDIEKYRIHCIKKPRVTEEFPFDSNTLVFKVGGKMFALLDVEAFKSVNLKCNPEKAVLLRETFDGVTPGFHMNKVHWNTVLCDGSIPDKLILEWTDESYNSVWKSLSARVRKEMEENG